MHFYNFWKNAQGTGLLRRFSLVKCNNRKKTDNPKKYKFQFIDQFDGDVKPFSCFGKKRAKRSRHRGGADRRSLSEHEISSIILPRLRAALPYVPLPALIERTAVVEAPETGTAAQIIRTWVSTPKSIPAGSSTGAGWGPGGGRLKVGVVRPVYPRSNERLCRSAHPPDVFFGYFLVRTQESDTYRCYDI